MMAFIIILGIVGIVLLILSARFFNNDDDASGTVCALVGVMCITGLILILTVKDNISNTEKSIETSFINIDTVYTIKNNITDTTYIVHYKE